MASSDTAQVSSLPLPPMQYINFYTDDNIRRNRAPLPPRPIHDTYSMFGNSFNADDNIIRSLESQVSNILYIFLQCCVLHCINNKTLLFLGI